MTVIDVSAPTGEQTKSTISQLFKDAETLADIHKQLTLFNEYKTANNSKEIKKLKSSVLDNLSVLTSTSEISDLEITLEDSLELIEQLAELSFWLLKGKDNKLHSSKTAEWGTPQSIIDAARTVLGGIDLDPASTYHFNQRVQARTYFSAACDGLTKAWVHYPDVYSDDVASWQPVSVFLNPPSGRYKGKPLSDNLAKIKGNWINKLFWQKLIDEVAAGHVSHAIYVAYSSEQLQTTQRDCTQSLLSYTLCSPEGRLDYVLEDGTPKTDNTHSSTIVYVPGLIDRTELFKKEFRRFGAVGKLS